MSGRSFRATTGIGNVVATEQDTVWKPHPQRPAGKSGVVLVHGHGAPTEFVDVDRPSSLILPNWLAWSGIPCVAAKMGGDKWGANPTPGYIEDAIDWLAAVCAAGGDDIPTDHFHVIAVSMGGSLAVRYAAANPGKVDSYTGIIPLSSLYNYYTSFPADQTEIATAWGVTPGNPLPAGADLLTLAAQLDGKVPTRLYYSTEDAIIDDADVIALAAAAGGKAIDASNFGHSEASIADVIARGGGGAAEIIRFLKDNGA